jgi:hypothetical protein
LASVGRSWPDDIVAEDEGRAFGQGVDLRQGGADLAGVEKMLCWVSGRQAANLCSAS